MKKIWPPLITDAARPQWTIWRDRVLTILVWVLFLALFIKQSLLFKTRIATYLSTPEAEWEFLLGPFLAVTGVMVAWLVLSAIFTYRRAVQARRRTPPPPLSLEVEAGHFGVTPADLVAARHQQIIAVAIEPDGRFRFEEVTYRAVVDGTNPPTPAPQGRSTPGR